VLLRDRRPGEAVDEVLDVLGDGRVWLFADLLQRRADARGGVWHVGPVERHPAGETRGSEAGRQRGGRQGDELGQARTARGPARVVGEVVAEQVLAGDGLVDRVDLVVDAVPDLTPDPALQRHAAALDLDDGDAHAGPGDDQVGLAILRAVAEAQVAEEDGVVGQLLLERPDEELLGRRREQRLVREDPRRHACLPAIDGASRVTITLLCSRRAVPQSFRCGVRPTMTRDRTEPGCFGRTPSASAPPVPQPSR
jgi:hypothetical protein